MLLLLKNEIILVEIFMNIDAINVHKYVQLKFYNLPLLKSDYPIFRIKLGSIIIK